MEFCHSTIYGSISLLFLPLNFYPHPIIPPSFNLGLYVAPEGKFFSRMFSCKVLKKIEGKNIYYRIHLIRPLKRLWTRRGRPRTVTGHAFKKISTAKSPLFPITSGHMHVIDGDEKIEKREKLKKKRKDDPWSAKSYVTDAGPLTGHVRTFLVLPPYMRSAEQPGCFRRL